MSFKELKWNDNIHGYYEVETLYDSFGDVLQNSEHFFNTICEAFFLISIPPFRPEDCASVIRNSIKALSSFIEKVNGLQREVLKNPAAPEEMWRDGATDLSRITNLNDLLEKLLNRCQSRIVMNADHIRDPIQRDGYTESIREKIEELTHVRPNETQECHIFVISQSCYRSIKKSKIELPDMIAGVLRCTVPEEERLKYLAEQYKSDHDIFVNFCRYVSERDSELSIYIPAFLSKQDDLTRSILIKQDQIKDMIEGGERTLGH